MRMHTHCGPDVLQMPSCKGFLSSFLKLEPQGRTTPYMHTQRHLTELEETPWKSHGEYTSTDAKENTTQPSYAPSANPRSQTHTYLEVEDSLPSSELNVTIVHSDFYSNSYKNRMGDDGPSYVRTWATNSSLTLATP